MRTACVQDIANMSSCSFYVYTVVPIKLGKVNKYEAKKIMSFIYLGMLNIERVQIDPKDIRRVKASTGVLLSAAWSQSEAAVQSSPHRNSCPFRVRWCSGMATGNVGIGAR